MLTLKKQEAKNYHFENIQGDTRSKSLRQFFFNYHEKR